MTNRGASGHGVAPPTRAMNSRRFHSITSSARASTLAGTLRPSALAVVRLMTRSNLVGCSTGMSAGFAPRRTLSTRSAARRNRSGRFAPHQTSRLDGLPIGVARRQSRGQRQGIDADAMGEHERVDTDIKCVCTSIERLEGGYDVFASLDFCCNDLEAERAGRCLDLAHIQHNRGTTDIGQDRQPAETGDNLAQKFESLGRNIGLLERQTGEVADTQPAKTRISQCSRALIQKSATSPRSTRSILPILILT